MCNSESCVILTHILLTKNTYGNVYLYHFHAILFTCLTDRDLIPRRLDVLVFWVDFVAFYFSFYEGPLGAPDTTRHDPR